MSQPSTIADVVRLLGDHPGSTLIAGGTDLMVEVNLHGRRPESVISLGNVAELATWTVDMERGVVTIGSGVPYAEIERGPLAEVVPALAQAARTVGSPQIRAAGTIGGNLGTCSPAGDTLPVLSALGATVNVESVSGHRAVAFDDFMVGVKRNSLKQGEFVTSVELPVVDGWQGYSKVGTRNAMVISTASACLVLDRAHGSMAVALGAVGPTIINCRASCSWLAANTDLRSTAPTESIVAEFAARCAAEARPITDHRSTADYRRHAVGVIVRRLTERAFA